MCQYCGNPSAVHSETVGVPGSIGSLLAKDPSFENMVLFMRDPAQNGTVEIVNDADPRSVITVNATDIAGDAPRLSALQGALSAWSAVVPLSFDIVTVGHDGDFSVVDDTLGQAFWNDVSTLNVGADWHERDPDGSTYGSYTFNTFIHELGHAFGLGHPGTYNRIIGKETNYVNSAQFTHDNMQYTVMTYFFQDQAGIGSTRWEAVTPMWADIEGLIQRFFSVKDANGTITGFQDIQLNTGDDVYGFSPDARAGFRMAAVDDWDHGLRRDIGFTIHDTGGNDTLDLSGSTDGVVLDLRPGHFSSANGHTDNIFIYPGHNADQAGYNIETGIGSQFDDTITGNDGNNTLIGGAGDDTLIGGAGLDHFVGGSGVDTVDYSYMTGDNYRIWVNLSLNRATGDDAGGDTFDGVENLRGGVRPNFFVGADGANEFFGNVGDDRLLGMGGDDRLHGGDGGDQLEGGSGSDWLFGDAGDDFLTGGAGKDMLAGGAGADRLVFLSVGDSSTYGTGQGNTCDQIADFSGVEKDRIDLSLVDADTGKTDDQAFIFIGINQYGHRAGELRFAQFDGRTSIGGDVNGDGVSDFNILLHGSIALKVADFVL